MAPRRKNMPFQVLKRYLSNLVNMWVTVSDGTVWPEEELHLLLLLKIMASLVDSFINASQNSLHLVWMFKNIETRSVGPLSSFIVILPGAR